MANKLFRKNNEEDWQQAAREQAAEFMAQRQAFDQRQVAEQQAAIAQQSEKARAEQEALERARSAILSNQKPTLAKPMTISEGSGIVPTNIQPPLRPDIDTSRLLSLGGINIDKRLTPQGMTPSPQVRQPVQQTPSQQPQQSVKQQSPETVVSPTANKSYMERGMTPSEAMQEKNPGIFSAGIPSGQKMGWNDKGQPYFMGAVQQPTAQIPQQISVQAPKNAQIDTDSAQRRSNILKAISLGLTGLGATINPRGDVGGAMTSVGNVWDQKEKQAQAMKQYADMNNAQSKTSVDYMTQISEMIPQIKMGDSVIDTKSLIGKVSVNTANKWFPQMTAMMGRQNLATGMEDEKQKNRLELAKTKHDLAILRQRAGVDVSAAREFNKRKLNAQESIAEAENMLVNINGLEKALDKIPAGLIWGNLEKLKSATVGNENVAKFQTLKSSIMGWMARTIALEKGVLTEQDVARIERALANIQETKENRAAHMAEIRDIIGRAIQVKKDLYLSNEAQQPAAGKELSDEEINAQIEAELSRGM